MGAAFEYDFEMMEQALREMEAVRRNLTNEKFRLSVHTIMLRAEDDSISKALRARLGYQSSRISKEIGNIYTIIESCRKIDNAVKSAEKKAESKMEPQIDMSLLVPLLSGALPGFFSGETCSNILKSIIGATFQTLFKGIWNDIFVGETKPAFTVSYRIDSVVFDDDGMKGGYQGSAYNTMEKLDMNNSNTKEIYDMVLKHYGNTSIEGAREFLAAMRSNGCGYMAIVNSIFVEYEGRPEEFEKTFGFPMYRNGDLNYDELMIDLYASTTKSKITPITNKDSPSYGYARGTSAGTEEEIMNNYLKDKNLSAEVSFVKTENTSFSDIEKRIRNGDKVIISDHSKGKLKLIKYDSHETYSYGNSEKGTGHAMMIVGTTTDGKYIVSSWGDLYYLDPQELRKSEKDGYYVLKYSS